MLNVKEKHETSLQNVSYYSILQIFYVDQDDIVADFANSVPWNYDAAFFSPKHLKHIKLARNHKSCDRTVFFTKLDIHYLAQAAAVAGIHYVLGAQFRQAHGHAPPSLLVCGGRENVAKEWEA